MSSIALGTLALDSISNALTGGGLGLEVGPYRCRIRSDQGRELAEPLHLLYREYPASLTPSGFIDLDLTLSKKRSGWRRREVEFAWEHESPFPPLPLDQVHPLFEWGLNWCISTVSGEDIVIHAAVLERNGGALVLPGEPGSGKSTLCAELCLSGWRLLSDELTIISATSGRAKPMPRPISLKDESIRLIRSRHADAVITTPIGDTRKGAIAYVRPPADSVARWAEEVPVRHVAFPRFSPAAPLQAQPLTQAKMLSRLLDNTFNVGLLGRTGFTGLALAVANASAHEITYGDLSDVAAWIDLTCQ